MRILKSHPILKMVNFYIIGNTQPSDKSYLWNFGSLLAFCLIIHIVTPVINYFRSLPSPPQPHAFVRLPLQCSADPWIITISLKIPGMLFTLWDNKENIYMAATAATAAAGVFVFMADVSTLDPSLITTSTDIRTILESLRYATDTDIMSVLDRFLVFWRSAHAEWERYGNLAGDLEREINAYFTRTIPDYLQQMHDALLNRIHGFGAGRVPNHLLNEYNNIVSRMAAYTNGNAPADLQGNYDNAVRSQETYAYFFNAIEEKISAIEDMYILRNPNYVKMNLEPL